MPMKLFAIDQAQLYWHKRRPQGLLLLAALLIAGCGGVGQAFNRPLGERMAGSPCINQGDLRCETDDTTVVRCDPNDGRSVMPSRLIWVPVDGFCHAHHLFSTRAALDRYLAKHPEIVDYSATQQEDGQWLLIF